MSSVDDIFKSNNFQGQKRHGAPDHHDDTGPASKRRVLGSTDGDNDSAEKYAGLSAREREIQEYIDSHDKDFQGPEVYDKRFLSKLLVQLEKAVNENAEKRVQYAKDPEKFFDSENNLYNAIRQLSIISETDLYYELEKSGSLDTLVSLIAHENVSVGAQTLQILEELFEPENEAGPAAMAGLARALVKEGVTGQIRAFLDACAKEQYEGYSSVLNLVANIAKIDEETGVKILKRTRLLQWSVEKFGEEDDGAAPKPSQAVLYHFAETLAELFILVPGTIAVFDARGVELLLVQLAALRAPLRPLPDDARDFFRDLFDILVSAVRYPWINDAFLENEGVQLMLLLLQANGKTDDEDAAWVRLSALKVLAESGRGFQSTGSATCLAIVENGGLKPLFSLLRKNKKKPLAWEILGIFSSMLEWLELGSTERDRLTAKFTEKSDDAVLTVIKLYQKTVAKLRKRHADDDDDDDDDDGEDLKLASRRNTACVILAWLAVEYKELKETIVKHVSVREIKSGLQEYASEIGLDESEQPESKPGSDKTASLDELVLESDRITSDMIQTLLSHLE